MLRLLAVLVALALPAQAQDRGAWFKSLKQPDAPTVSCCDVSDCKKTEAQWQGGGWFAKLPDGTPVPIPDKKIVTKTPSLDGEAYLCANPKSRHVYCFVPPDFGT